MKLKYLLAASLASLLMACEQSPQQRDGQAIYYQSCVSCHDRGHGGAPIRGDQEAWQQRLEKGQDTLLKNLKDGYNGMPPKGACFDCSEQELALVLEYLLTAER